MLPHILSFKGRIKRGEYALSAIPLVIVLNVLVLPGIGDQPILAIPAYIFGIWAILAQGSKRCHDLNKPGWFQVIPFYGLFMLFDSGLNTPNRFGPPPNYELPEATEEQE